MPRIVALNYAAPIAVGHTVEITEFADTRPEKKRKGSDRFEAFRLPVVVDLDTGIRYMNHVHASAGGNGGNSFTPNRYPLVPRPDLQVAATWRGRVTACTIVMIEGLENQHTTLVVEPVEG
ncbi:hypothetical protein M1843_14220 [Isoptericola sp. 4D.3]|uniref:Uncharacterized protein n=1 Tax=Isoptericola peretonis TaxID=2918523 RepID=A0ABT0J5X2_9MICO|nr:hypothetical protein [Isoptericola sp. 4D.3]